MSTTNILDLNNRIDALEKNSGGGGSADSAKRSDIATEFNTTTAYTAGCFVYYEGKLYQFNADHAAGAWDPTDVVEANVTDQVVSNASAIAGLTASDVAYDNTTSGLTATNEQAAIDELADSYPASKVMLSDGTTSVGDALTYSETEHVVGTWIDGKTIYEKTINFGSLPNNTTKSVQHNVANIDNIIDMRAFAATTGTFICLNFPDGSDYVRLVGTKTDVTIKSTYDTSAFSGYVTLRYTKTS